MSSSTVIDVFGHILYSFTRGVTDHYNPDEPEFTEESFGYSPLESTGREWYLHPVEELIYQEYSDRDATSLDYLTSYSFNIEIHDASSIEESTNTPETHQNDGITMAWRRLRPCIQRTILKSMYFGALISLLTSLLVGMIYTLVSYISFKTIHTCQYTPLNATSLKVQWVRTMSDVVSCAFLYIWFFALLNFLFRPFQLRGIKRKLFFVCLITYFLDTIYRVALQALGISHSYVSYPVKIPLNALFLINQCLQVHFLTRCICTSSRKKIRAKLFFKMIVPSCFSFLSFFLVASLIYPAYNKADVDKKLLIATFAPLVGVLVKVTSRICVQTLYNITHPGYSYVLLSPLYCGSAILFRVLQADLGSLYNIAILGIIHGAAEVIERSTMVFIDHICHMLRKRKSAPWGSFRTPRRERLMADIAIMSMLYESTAIVSMNGYLYLYQFVYLKGESFVNLLQSFAIQTAVSLAIEWVFNSVSLAIETRYQNMPVMAIWRRRWKRHILVAIVNAVPMALWTSTNLLDILHGRFTEISTGPCKMPFT